MSFIDGSSSCPSQFISDDSGLDTTTVNMAYEPWIQKDQLVLSWIVGSHSETVLASITHQTTARAAWLFLKKLYAFSNHHHILHLRSQLMNFHHNDLCICTIFGKWVKDDFISEIRLY
ncbi:hypothetical protein L3X38_011759 [Prunus dulcis]|uniref:Uncharacterized protein n=1 Tax=Prunus dulcis TaxID=3755 RepID=A0AAD4ZG03_PRUDU|nr:hypothetical protein L3X38_011759 [Prunus dulcis]